MNVGDWLSILTVGLAIASQTPRAWREWRSSVSAREAARRDLEAIGRHDDAMEALG